nr:hypothetical protein GCM10020063_109910 [Dactylosporangium thailandense]
MARLSVCESPNSTMAAVPSGSPWRSQHFASAALVDVSSSQARQPQSPDGVSRAATATGGVRFRGSAACVAPAAKRPSTRARPSPTASAAADGAGVPGWTRSSCEWASSRNDNRARLAPGPRRRRDE